MKKFYRLFILAISFLFFACNGLFLDSSLGKIVVQLPNGNSGNASGDARNAIYACADTTSHYIITLEGPTPKTVQQEGGSTVTISELQPGTYTVTVEAYSKEGGYRVAYNSQTVSVKAGEIADVFLEMKKGFVANTNFTWWNYDSGSGGYKFKTFSSTPTSSNLIIQEDSEDFTAANNCTIEDNEGNVYYIFDGALYCRSVELCNFSGGYNINDVNFLYYDEKNDYIYGIGTCYDGRGPGNESIIRLSGEDVRKKISNGQYSVPSTIYKLNGSGFNFADVDGGAVAITAFAIRGDDFYFVVKTIEPDEKKMAYHLYKATLTFSGSLANANCTKVLSVAPSENGNTAGVSNVRGKITDITIASDGNAYALICDSYLEIESKNIAGCSPSDAPEQKVYSRGAIIKISPDGSVSEPLGYHSQERKLTTANYENKPNVESSSSYYYLPKMSLYAPSFSERSKEFYGPQKIIAKKPDELYIVDSGVNFVLSNFKPNTKQHNGNAYLHDRIMKVDLKNFGLSLVAEKRECYYSYTEGSTAIIENAALFTTHNFSGSFSLTTIMYTINYGTAYIYPATLEDEI